MPSSGRRWRAAYPFWVLLLLGPLTGCQFLRGEKDNVPLRVLEVRHGYVCGTQDAASRVTLLPDVGAARAWKGGNGFIFPRGDSLAQGRYVLVEMGSRPTGGFSFAVSHSASLSDGELQLTAVYLSPPPGRITSQMVTSPCSLLALPVTAAKVWRVLLFDGAGTLLADSAPPDAPKPAWVRVPVLPDAAGNEEQEEE